MSSHEPPLIDRDTLASPHSPAPPAYELRDARVTPLVIAAVGLFALLAASMFGMRSLFRSLDEGHAGDADVHSMAVERQIPPEPRLQVRPAAELEAFQAEQARTLSTYGWIDRGAGVVRIPVERAMELVVERGLPQRDAPAVQGEGAGK